MSSFAFDPAEPFQALTLRLILERRLWFTGRDPRCREVVFYVARALDRWAGVSQGHGYGSRGCREEIESKGKDRESEREFHEHDGVEIVALGRRMW